MSTIEEEQLEVAKMDLYQTVLKLRALMDRYTEENFRLIKKGEYICYPSDKKKI